MRNCLLLSLLEVLGVKAGRRVIRLGRLSLDETWLRKPIVEDS